MKVRRAFVTAAGALAILLGAPGTLVPAPEPTPSVPASGTAQRLERFRGDVQIGGKSVSVAIDTWLIPNGQKIVSLPLPFPGSMVVEVRGGTIVTVIGGRRVKRRPGDFWTVPAKTLMSLETEDDSAAISTTVFADTP